MKALSRQSSLVKILPTKTKEKKMIAKEALKKSYSQVLETPLSRNSSVENHTKDLQQEQEKNLQWEFTLDVMQRYIFYSS